MLLSAEHLSINFGSRQLLEEIFIYELGGADYAVRDIVL